MMMLMMPVYHKVLAPTTTKDTIDSFSLCPFLFSSVYYYGIAIPECGDLEGALDVTTDLEADNGCEWGSDATYMTVACVAYLGCGIVHCWYVCSMLVQAPLYCRQSHPMVYTLSLCATALRNRTQFAGNRQCTLYVCLQRIVMLSESEVTVVGVLLPPRGSKRKDWVSA
jgi:hypothetical protein